ncbi:MAG TPA: heme d1 biosynthesis radical SAM protein NirJ [Rhodospirillales bacterium]|jgi:heme d1 biosynthesis radical SAM protein NirJ|nr:heme d1 biosynthesis radical SAM protein NirJ [Rhodospirillales bacterium]|tara:strand:- start:228 stop:1412 length:1185 start_codon:yes stop_codon:yes gene_type:complete
MFRISQFMREIAEPTPLEPMPGPAGPVVIWNLIRRCNLNCRHCYSMSADTDFQGELTTNEVFAVLEDLKAFGVPALILSGGEPLLRPDIFEITARAKELGFFVALSTNGTLIDDGNIGAIAAAGYDYLGISLDGIGPTHDRFRRKAGAFDSSLAAARRCRDAGIKVGLRFTLTIDNAAELPDLLQLCNIEGIDRFYLSHLNYAGRGNRNRTDDTHLDTTRRAVDLLFDTAWSDARAGRKTEIVTGNNDADGVYLLYWVRRHFPRLETHIRAKLVQWGGNASGVNIANIDNSGAVHPDTMWWHHDLGNVREQPFSEIWENGRDSLMVGLRRQPRHIGGRCGVCAYFDICGGNTRVRALQVTGDPWAEDPACYLSDEEIGVEPTGAPRRRGGHAAA